MADRLYLIKEGEISLKGGNRNLFEKRLRHNIKDKLRPYHSEIDKQKGRLYAYIEESTPKELVEKALATTSGITGFAEAHRTEKDMAAIEETARKILPGAFSCKGSFRITVKREDKAFPFSSKEIAIRLAEVVHELYPELTVNLDDPDNTLTCEIRNEAYLYTGESRSVGGLPVGTAGKGMLLLSGGIDSPVAGAMMAKRGMKADAIYFHAYPYTSEMALEKVRSLASEIAPYMQGLRLFVVPFTEGQLNIKARAFEDATTLMFRASMMQLASRVAGCQDMQCIVTGEALSQVASQTLAAMSFTDSMADLLVLRPLVGLDKEEIISKAKKIGTYETSILPYEDCCVIFSPKHPITNPDRKAMREHYQSLGMDEYITKALSETKIYSYNANGEETGVWDFTPPSDQA